VIDVHARDVIQRLADGGVADVGEFEWTSQVPISWGESA
jgi:hypothetical protein